MRCKRVVTGALVWVLASSAGATCDDGAYRAFDFWIGGWDVSLANGDKAGTNTITREEGGCALVERWQGARGSTGRSLNYYDPDAQRWRREKEPPPLADKCHDLWAR